MKEGDDLEKKLNKWTMLSALAGLADATTTYVNLQSFGIDYEGNPLMLEAFSEFGVAPTLYGTKAAVVGVCYLLSKWNDNSTFLPKVATGVWGLAALANVYFGITT